jgi:hypothetical protein
MVSATTDRRMGVTGDKGIKAPVQAATLVNIVLSGEQTIDGVAVKAIGANGYPDRVLVKNQTNPIDNGIWDVATGQWTRSIDANGTQDLVSGTTVLVIGGSQQFQFWGITSANPIIPGTTATTWSYIIVYVVSSLPAIVTSFTALRALAHNSVKYALATGAAANGDGGGGQFWYDSTDTTSTDNGIDLIVATDGGRWKLFQFNYPNVGQFQVLPANADNATALNNAFSLNTDSNVAHIPNKALNFGTALNITTPGHYYGDGFYSALKPTAGFGAGNNNIHIAPNPANAFYLTVMEKFALGSPLTGTRVGLAGIYMDTNVAGSFNPKFTLRDTAILQGSGVAFLAINNPANNVNGGMYCANLENSMFYGGINLQNTGDSNCIHKNIITGTNVGIYASNVSGASLLSIVDNNITTTGGVAQIDAGSRFKFLRNNCEQTVTFTGGATYMMNVSGGNGTMNLPEIRGNHFGLFSSVVNSGCLYINNTQGALVSENTFVNSNASAVAIVVGATATNTRIGANNYGSAVTTKVTDGGIGTMGVIKPITTFANAWANCPTAPTASGRFYKDILGTVHLAGVLNAGTITQGTLMFTLPVGFRPDQPGRFSVVSDNAGTLVLGEVRIDTAGNVTIWHGQNTYLALDGISFPAAGLADTTSDL